MMPSWYRAEVLLVPKDENATLGFAGQLAGLTSLAGIDIGPADTAEAVATLGSRDFAREFIQDEGLLPVLFESQWDPSAKSWRSRDPQEQPDIRDGIEFFDRSIRSVSEDRRTRLVTMAIEWKDPNQAAEWANLLVDRLNERMRRQALMEAEANVKYLQDQLNANTPVALDQAIGKLLEGEMQKLMLARGNRDFAFRVIDRADVPKRRSKPNRVLIVMAATIIGGGLSVVIVGLLVLSSGRRKQDS
jgi:uncharacterized protein involved in exopolysaccharide biosynthesis